MKNQVIEEKNKQAAIKLPVCFSFHNSQCTIVMKDTDQFTQSLPLLEVGIYEIEDILAIRAEDASDAGTVAVQTEGGDPGDKVAITEEIWPTGVT